VSALNLAELASVKGFQTTTLTASLKGKLDFATSDPAETLTCRRLPQTKENAPNQSGPAKLSGFPFPAAYLKGPSGLNSARTAGKVYAASLKNLSRNLSI